MILFICRLKISMCTKRSFRCYFSCAGSERIRSRKFWSSINIPITSTDLPGDVTINIVSTERISVRYQAKRGMKTAIYRLQTPPSQIVVYEAIFLSDLSFFIFLVIFCNIPNIFILFINNYLPSQLIFHFLAIPF